MLVDWKYENFKESEFTCKGKKCCGNSAPMNHLFMTELVRIRAIYGKPITVTSGFRCKKHNTSVGGTENSNHTKGLAADITATKTEDLKILFYLAKCFFEEVIFYEDKKFIHVGVPKSLFK